MNQHGEFVLSREKGVSKAGKYIVLSTYEDTSLSSLKLAYITTKKVGKAYQRNAIRRKLRAISQKHGDQIEAARYVVVIARWRAAEATFQQLEADWLRLARKLNIIDS